MNYYQHHIGDFNNATRHLTRVERVLYRDLIELYYDTEKPITSDLDYLARRIIATTEEDKNALNVVLSEFFTLESDGYHNSRCDIEIEKYQSNSKAKRKAGKASAAKRQQNSTGVEHVNNKCATNQEPVTTNHKPVTKEIRRFTPPSSQDLQSYIVEKSLNVDHEQFIDFYQSKGWLVGKTKMKDWKAAARNWSKRQTGGRNEKANGSRKLTAVERVAEAGRRQIEQEQRGSIVDITPHEDIVG